MILPKFINIWNLFIAVSHRRNAYKQGRWGEWNEQT